MEICDGDGQRTAHSEPCQPKTGHGTATVRISVFEHPKFLRKITGFLMRKPPPDYSFRAKSGVWMRKCTKTEMRPRRLGDSNDSRKAGLESR